MRISDWSSDVCSSDLHPDILVMDVARVLKPGGAFIGSTSCLETYQSNSLRSYTPYGLKRLLGAGGFEKISLYPGIDGLTLYLYHLFHEPKWFYWFFKIGRAHV